MKLNLRQKSRFYHELGQLLRSGIAFPAALQTMSTETRGNLRRLIAALQRAAARGETIADSFASLRPAVSDLEIGIFAACEQSGKLDEACRYLSDYFETLDRARTTIVKKSAYPIFMLHFGVFVLGVPKLFLGGTAATYLKQTVGFLLLVYCAAALFVFAASCLVRLAETNSAVDRLLRALPVVGKLRRAFSLSRFCATYEMQLAAGVNVIDGLLSAARASRSAVLLEAVQRALPAIRAGGQVGPQLAASRAFPSQMIRALRLGEDTGELDAELKRLTEVFNLEALNRIETVTDWLPKLVYISIAVFLAYQIIDTYKTVLETYRKALDF